MGSGFSLISSFRRFSHVSLWWSSEQAGGRGKWGGGLLTPHPITAKTGSGSTQTQRLNLLLNNNKKNPYLFYSSPTEGKHPFRLAAVSFSCLPVVSLSDVGVGEHDRKLSFMSLTRCFLPEISWWWWSLELDWIHVSVAVEFSPHEESPSLSLFTSGIKRGVFTVSLIRFQHWSMEETTKKT